MWKPRGRLSWPAASSLAPQRQHDNTTMTTTRRRHSNAATPRHRDTATPRHRDTATRRHGDTATRRHGDTATQHAGVTYSVRGHNSQRCQKLNVCCVDTGENGERRSREIVGLATKVARHSRREWGDVVTGESRIFVRFTFRHKFELGRKFKMRSMFRE